MPVNKSAMLDLMIRLGQLLLKMDSVVDRESILEYVEISNKERVLQRFAEIAQQTMSMKKQCKLLICLDKNYNNKWKILLAY